MLNMRPRKDQIIIIIVGWVGLADNELPRTERPKERGTMSVLRLGDK